MSAFINNTGSAASGSEWTEIPYVASDWGNPADEYSSTATTAKALASITESAVLNALHADQFSEWIVMMHYASAIHCRRFAKVQILPALQMAALQNSSTYIGLQNTSTTSGASSWYLAQLYPRSSSGKYYWSTWRLFNNTMAQGSFYIYGR